MQSAGTDLPAHEVAHTVQQAGGATSGPQYQLEVSQPHDAAEHEADRAADAMVGGHPASVGAAGAPIARQAAGDEKSKGPSPTTKDAAPKSTPSTNEQAAPDSTFTTVTSATITMHAQLSNNKVTALGDLVGAAKDDSAKEKKLPLVAELAA